MSLFQNTLTDDPRTGRGSVESTSTSTGQDCGASTKMISEGIRDGPREDHEHLSCNATVLGGGALDDSSNCAPPRVSFHEGATDNRAASIMRQRRVCADSIRESQLLLEEAMDEKDRSLKVNRRKYSGWLNYDSLLRHPEDSFAMKSMQRFSIGFGRWCGNLFVCSEDKRKPHVKRISNQYRIPPREEKQYRYWLSPKPSWFWSFKFETILLWFYKTTFTRMILAFVVIYYALISIFAFVLNYSARVAFNLRNEICITGLELTDSGSSNWDVTFELSWTTFSTVGYGTTSVPANVDCQGVRYLLTCVAFTGVIYAGFCSAVLFNKIQRLHQRAHVTFGSCVCLIYGSGLTHGIMSFEEDVEDQRHQHSYCRDDDGGYPYLEFRCVNDRAVQGGGEVIRASLECMVYVLEATVDSDEPVRLDQINAEDSSRRSPLWTGHSSWWTNTSPSSNQSGNEEDDSRNPSAAEAGVSASATDAISGRALRVDVKRAYKKLPIYPNKHPYFSKGVWHCRHVLDGSSPLLKRDVRSRINALRKWPFDLDDPQSIRECLSPNVKEIFLTFSGTSNLTADYVFCEHSYDMSDVFVGWKFAGMVYLKESSEETKDPFGMELDMSLVHDIVPQDGGGEEAIG